MMRRMILMCVCVILVAGACSDDADTASTATEASTTTAGQSTTTEAPPTTTEAPPTTVQGTMRLTSTAFENEDAIPQQFTCDGSDISPALVLADVPSDAQSMALIMEDPDAPNGTWDHWIAYDIPVGQEIAEDIGELGIPGVNSWGRTGYGGPCPPSGTHRYFFTVYALDEDLGLDSGATKDDVLEALDGHVLAEAMLMGTYSR